jgi:phosphate transport system permease protein
MSDRQTLFGIAAPDWKDPATQARMRRRHRGTRWLRLFGIGAITAAISLLALLIGSIVYLGYPALTQTMVTLDVPVDPQYIDADNLAESDWNHITREAIAGLYPADATGARDRDYREIISRGAYNLIRNNIRDMVVADPGLVGQTVEMTVQVSDPFDQLNKGNVRRDTPEELRRVNDRQIAFFDQLVDEGRISRVLNRWLITNPDSRFPELAGLKGALLGSAYALLVCFLIAFPMGIAAAVYLDVFAPKNWATDLIEVNINNLAAVPSIVFGLLGLAVFLNFFGLPRSAPLVGGMALALMTLPTIIIATRASLKAVPPSIREGALGIGASPVQVMTHHVLPLAMPGILTGTIIGLAQALGETAPLLLIGMNTFITSAPESVFDKSVALPTQIYMWFDSPERGFVSRTAAAIMVLLGFLLIMNAVAVFLRARLERRW